MNRLVSTTRPALIAVSVLLGAGVVFGGATSGQAIASPVDKAPTSNATSAKRAPSCPSGQVCLWSGINFVGRKLIASPVPSGQCLRIGDIGSAWHSVYNRSRFRIRVWEITYTDPDDGERCAGDNNLIGRHSRKGRFSFLGADGLGGF